MSYQESLEAAGDTIIAFEQFGSYQGEWYALVEWNGERGWVNGCFGSCSYCDAFEAEFGWSADEEDGYQQKLADFGRVYLEGMMSQDAAEKAAGENISWDSDAEEMLKFVQEWAQR